MNFKNEPYYPNLEDYKPPLSELNKMELIQMSFNNQYWLFYNRILDKFLIYSLGKVQYLEQKGNIFSSMNNRELWEFEFKYELDFENTFMYKYLTPKRIDIKNYFRKNPTLFKINA